MTAEKEPVDLRKVEPVVHGNDPEGDAREDVETVGTPAPGAATIGSSPAAGVFPEDEDETPADPDDLDRLRRG